MTFPMGSVDGDTQTVTLTALHDMLVEGASETVKLGLGNPSVAAIVGDSTYTATITDTDTATVQFQSAAITTTDESATPCPIVVRLTMSAGVSLGVAVTAVVSDAGTGSATSGSDYAAFAPHTVTFAAASASGSTQTVMLNVMSDATVELDETVRLALSSPSAGAQLGATTTEQVTIHDDDASGPSSFVGTQGATGVETTLTDNDLVTLGTQTLNAGPNAGTLVRVTNAGGAPMQLAAPHLTGTNTGDFDVTVESAPLVPAADVTTADDPALAVVSPLQMMPASSGLGVALAFDPDRANELAPMSKASLYGFPLPGEGDVTLQLQRIPLPISDDAVLRVDGADVAGGLKPLVSDLSLWTGNVLEVPGSRVFLALSNTGPQGFIELPNQSDRLVQLAHGASGELRAVRSDSLAAMGFSPPPFYCVDAPLVPGAPVGAQQLPTTSGEPGIGALNPSDCRVAIETDYQLYQRFGSTNGLTNYVTKLIGAISAQYFEDVQATISIAYLGVYTTAGDPWTSQDSGGNASALLSEFRTAWAPSSWPVSANLAHFISGASLGGGVAYVGVLCNQSFGFGVSGNVTGNINWGTWNGQPANFTWDFVVVAHEMGHNFGSSHTHDYCPPLDQCYSNCTGTTVCSQGTIMSYCHTCGSGMSNIQLHFHSHTANIMRQSVNSSCLGLSALLGGDHVQYRVTFDPHSATGQRDAVLEFQHDAANAPTPFRVRLRGTAQ
jgi:hypothetical protein